MGTETKHIDVVDWKNVPVDVKLNNPLMGTETKATTIICRNVSIKLN